MTKGIIIPIMEKYEELLLCNLHILRNELECKIPIELWQIGQEISDNMKKTLDSLKENYELSYKNLNDYTDNPEHWRGWQMKAFIVKHTEFDEIILCDCDSVFIQNPEIIFDDPNYIATGTYFFKDWIKHEPKDADSEVPARIDFIKELLPEKSPYFPEEWNYIYGEETPFQIPQMWYYQESGVVCLNKSIHPDVVETIYELNDNHKETYKYVYGDKETFWLSCVINNKPFYMNEPHAENFKVNTLLPYYKSNINEIPNALTHFYNGKYFFSQKGYPIGRIIENNEK
jgi:hypothetical protein